MKMGYSLVLFSNHRCLFILYGFVSFFVLVLMVGYSSKSPIFSLVRWQQTQTSLVKTIPCLPRKNIVFLKTHKCASSSVQNILMRYAHQNDLTLVLPVDTKSHVFSLKRPFRKEMIAAAPWENLGYNILCHHLVFNKDVIQTIMPKNSVYLSIVRNPVDMFDSLYEYGSMQDAYQMDIEEYARGTKNASIIPKLRNRTNSGMGRNQMLYDFGVHPSYFNNRVLVEKAIYKLDKVFDFVLIADYFDESIILLRHILCWDLDDVIGLAINARMDTYKRNLSSDAVKNLEEWNWGDKMLYDHFFRKFEETLKEFGEEQLNIEVQELRKRRQDWFQYCVQKKVESKNLTLYKIWSSKVEGYVLKPNIHNKTCRDLVKPENYFTSELRQHQLIRSIINGAILPNYGPTSFKRMIDFKYLKENDLTIARNLIQNQYKYRRRFAEKIVNSKKNKD